jgi:hypothetical protein
VILVELVLGACALLAVFAVVMGLWSLFRCVHAWELVDKTEMDSGFENMAKAGVKDGSVWASDYVRLAARTVIIAMRCPKCGAARIYREKSTS